MHGSTHGSGHIYAWDTICMGVCMGVVTCMHGTLHVSPHGGHIYAWEWSHVYILHGSGCV